MRTAFKSVRTFVFLCVAGLALTCGRRLRADTDENGFVVDWLVYGPLAQAPGCCPDGITGRLDYLTDGVEFAESTIKPTAGLEVLPDFGVTAASTGFHPIFTGDVESWSVTNTGDPAGDGSIINVNPDTVDFNLIFAPGFDSTNQGCPAPAENAVAYAVAYIKNATGGDLHARFELASDDSIQVKVDDCEVTYHNIGRGFGAPGTVQDRAVATIPSGSHRLFVKVFNGCGGFGFRLRIIDRATEKPADLSYSLDPVAFAVPDLEPSTVALDVSHTAAPDRLIGFDNPVTVTITGAKIDPNLDDVTKVTIRENLIANTSLVPGSSVPPPTSQQASSLTWVISVGDLVATGIQFDFKFNGASCGGETSGCLDGEFTVPGSPCSVNITGTACSVAVALNALFLGDIAGGGDGLATKSPDICGIRLDTGILLTCDAVAPDNHHTDDTQGCAIDPNDLTLCDPQNPQPVTDTPYVDSVFFMSTDTMAINSKGVEYSFDPLDLNPQGGLPSSWNHILSNSTHDIDKGVGNIVCGGKGPFATGVGVHASAGITFNLAALRTKYGNDKVVSLSSLVGIDGCAGHTTQYIIYSNDTEILTDFTYKQDTPAGFAAQYTQDIPAAAKYVTFATGTAGDGDGCDHGVWAEARIFPTLPVAVISTDVDTGPVALTVAFNGSGSTAPVGSTIICYNWDFGDGSSGSGAQVSHTYTNRGKYTAKLSVQSDKGLGGSSTKDITGTFACGSVAPFTSQDVGSPVVAGCARSDGDCLVVFGGGKGTGQASDQFQYVYKHKTGDVSVTAQVKSLLLDSKGAGRAGLMFRDSTAVDAAFAYFHLSSSLGGIKAAFMSRAAAGQSATSGNLAALVPPDAWLKLERSGVNFICSTSPDGQTYTPVKTLTLTAPAADMLSGIAVTAADANGRGFTIEATVCNISYSDEQIVGKTFHRGDADDNGKLELTDAVRILGFLYLGKPAPTCFDAADADDNGKLELTDAVRILGFLYLGKPAPTDPGPPPAACGVDPTPEDGGTDLGCDTYTHC